MELLSAELLPVALGSTARLAGDPLPMINHNGTCYAVADPGMEWTLRVNVHRARLGKYRAMVKLDGRCVGYSMVESAIGGTCALNFEGFAHTHPITGKISYKAFKFGALTPAADAATVEHPDQIQAGRIDVICEAVVVVPGKREPRATDPTWGTDAASKKLPEGKKWFLQPGLQAAEGSTVKQTNFGWDTTMYQKVHDLQPLRLRYDTADNLRLRKILNPAKPQHAAILARAGAAAGNTGQPGAAGSSSGSRQPKQERCAAGVKRERGADEQQQAAAVPASATAETINLIDEAPAPLRVGGRLLAADELAVCDLAGSDDEEQPVWQVQKKQAIEVAV